MTTPIREADLEKLINRLLHCQKMVDAGGRDWHKYGDELIEIQTNKLPTLLTKHTERAVLDGQQTSFIKALQERNPADQLVILGGLLYQYLMEETNATTANITLDNFSRHGKVLGDLEIKATLKTQLEAKDE